MFVTAPELPSVNWFSWNFPPFCLPGNSAAPLEKPVVGQLETLAGCKRVSLFGIALVTWFSVLCTQSGVLSPYFE